MISDVIDSFDFNIDELFDFLNDYIDNYYESSFMQTFFLSPDFIIKSLDCLVYRCDNGSKDN